MGAHGISRSSMTINSIWKARGRRPTLRRTCKVFIPRDLRLLDTLRLPAAYEAEPLLVQRLKAFGRHKLHHWLLVAAISAYVYAGALLFKHLDEQCYENCSTDGAQPNMTQLRDALIEGIVANASSWRRGWGDEARKALEEHETMAATQSDCDEGKRLSIQNAILFCFTVITTIGYGNIAPCTDVSRAATIVYAFFGVPLMFLVLADLGKLSTKAIKFIFLWFKMFYVTGTIVQRRAADAHDNNKPLQYMTVSWRTVTPIKSGEDIENDNRVTTLTIHNDDLYRDLDFLNPDEVDHKHVQVRDDFALPVTLAVAMVTAYMALGAFLFHTWEGWSPLEAFYFVFVSMTTIGFGDYVLGNEDRMIGGLAYLVFGLTLNSMCINVVREKLTGQFQKARVRIGNNTVLNVEALLADEDRKSRTRVGEYGACFGHRKVNGQSGPQMKINGARVGESGKDVQHRGPQIKINGERVGKSGEDVQHRGPQMVVNGARVGESGSECKDGFALYDSPYNTIQDENALSKLSPAKLSKDMGLNVPPNRFTFYDSPYDTIQDENVPSYPQVKLSPARLSKDVMLNVPTNRFKFYDSPYNTIQDENEDAANYRKRYRLPEFTKPSLVP